MSDCDVVFQTTVNIQVQWGVVLGETLKAHTCIVTIKELETHLVVSTVYNVKEGKSHKTLHWTVSYSFVE